MDYSITGKSFVRLAGSTAVIAITGLLCLTWNSKSNPPEAVKVSVLADSVGMIVSVALDPQSGTLYAILEGDRELHAYSSRLPTTNPWRRAAARTADVPKTSDEVRLPGALAVDGAGNLY
ncbi:hypothetical protein, partial [Massilia sp. TSP1-1-2]|uniref:hypothetical protein n=1 Tax=Massilia sp. TSP1-1-2 TaxID=2804649 RepID=UPI003CFB0EEB